MDFMRRELFYVVADELKNSLLTQIKGAIIPCSIAEMGFFEI
jgi:hypothetical protein